jgi:hypothetical protein
MGCAAVISLAGSTAGFDIEGLTSWIANIMNKNARNMSFQSLFI